MSSDPHIEEHLVQEVRRGEPGYPAGLAGVADAPDKLFALGHLPTSGYSVAIVGARAASGHAMAATRALAEELAWAGVVIVSGGAVGIDAAAHRGALDADGDTVAVMATGLDQAYPARNRPLFDEILASGRGALVSPFPMGVPPRAYRFVRRNRIIAGLADAVVVVEAGLASGALYTAAAARDYGRVLGALPGSPGCEALIAQGAAVVQTAADLEVAIEGRPRRPLVTMPEPASEEARVLAALSRELARGEDELSQTTGLQARDVARALTGLELEGLAVLLPGRAYVRSSLADELAAG